jgi:putative transposase
MPWFKGRAERFVGTLNSQLVHQLPGTTRSNASDRGGYKSGELATMTLSEVRHVVVKYVTQIYHERVHATLGTSPREAWEEGIASHPPSVVVNPDTLKLSMALRENCAISGSRIQFENLRYSSPMLAALRNELKLSKGNASVRVDVLYSWRDISVAYVYDTIRKTYVDVPCVTRGVTPGMTLDEYLLLRKAGKRPHRAADYDLAEDRVALRNEIRAKQKHAARKLEREKAAKRKQKSDKALLPANAAKQDCADSPLLSRLNKKEQQRVMAIGESSFDMPPPEKPTGNRFDYTVDDIDSISKTIKE